MCITLILVFNLRFNLEDQAPTFFYSECGRGFQLYNDMGDNTAWGLSFFLANVIDFLITQPLILLALAIYASWKPSKHENDGVHISHALENGGMKQIEGKFAFSVLLEMKCFNVFVPGTLYIRSAVIVLLFCCFFTWLTNLGEIHTASVCGCVWSSILSLYL